MGKKEDEDTGWKEDLRRCLSDEGFDLVGAARILDERRAAGLIVLEDLLRSPAPGQAETVIHFLRTLHGAEYPSPAVLLSQVVGWHRASALPEDVLERLIPVLAEDAGDILLASPRLVEKVVDLLPMGQIPVFAAKLARFHYDALVFGDDAEGLPEDELIRSRLKLLAAAVRPWLDSKSAGRRIAAAVIMGSFLHMAPETSLPVLKRLGKDAEESVRAAVAAAHSGRWAIAPHFLRLEDFRTRILMEDQRVWHSVLKIVRMSQEERLLHAIFKKEHHAWEDALDEWSRDPNPVLRRFTAFALFHADMDPPLQELFLGRLKADRDPVVTDWVRRFILRKG